MPRLARKPAVCIVKVDPQPWGVLITVIVNRDLVGGQPEQPRNFTQMSEAMKAVAAFLQDFTEDRPPM